MTTLTAREIQCVKLAASCLLHKEIGEQLGMSKVHVDGTLSYARKKLNLRNEKELVHWALARRLVPNKFKRAKGLRE